MWGGLDMRIERASSRHLAKYVATHGHLYRHYSTQYRRGQVYHPVVRPRLRLIILGTLQFLGLDIDAPVTETVSQETEKHVNKEEEEDVECEENGG
jgi:hypothetical protein